MVNVGLGRSRTRFARPGASHISICPGAISKADGPKARICRIQGSPYESKLSTGPLKRQTPHFRAASALLTALRGEDEIRTRGTLETYVGLANRWFQPLTHLSMGTVPRVLSNLAFGPDCKDTKINYFAIGAREKITPRLNTCCRGGGRRASPQRRCRCRREWLSRGWRWLRGSWGWRRRHR